MGTYFKAIDRFAAALTRGVIARRWLVIAGAVTFAAVIGFGASRLEFSTNYRVFFSEANPELQAFENLQNTYTKNDNFFFVIEPRSGSAFDAGRSASVMVSPTGAPSISLTPAITKPTSPGFKSSRSARRGEKIPTFSARKSMVFIPCIISP